CLAPAAAGTGARLSCTGARRENTRCRREKSAQGRNSGGGALLCRLKPAGFPPSAMRTELAARRTSGSDGEGKEALASDQPPGPTPPVGAGGGSDGAGGADLGAGAGAWWVASGADGAAECCEPPPASSPG